MPKRSRAYTHPVSAQEIARRIVRSITDEAACGVVRTPEQYTTRPEVLCLVAALLTTTQKELSHEARPF